MIGFNSPAYSRTSPGFALQSLPTELLVHVLLFTLSDDPNKWCIRDVQTLALVCRGWLDLVLKNPSFWPLISTCHTLQIVNLVLKRNPFGPLDVDLNLSGEPWRVGSIWVPPSEQILHQAFSHVSRWRHVCILGEDLSPEMVSIIESAESAESLLLGLLRSPFQDSTPLVCIDLRHFARLKHLQLADIRVDWANLPQLPFLRALRIDSVPAPEIERLHVLLGSAPRLDLITFRNLRDYDDSKHRLDESGQQIFELPPVSLTALTKLELHTVPSTWSAHLLTIIRPSKALSTSVRQVDASVLQNHNFHQLAAHALIGSGYVRISVNVDTLFVKGVHIKSEIAEDRTKMGRFDADFIMPTFDEWYRVFPGLGATVGSKPVFLQFGFLKEISIADLVETLKSAPSILPAVRTIQIMDPHLSLILLGLLSRQYLDDLGEATWLAPGLEELILSRSGAVDNKSIMHALEQLWLKRYARLDINLDGCSRLRRLVCGSGDLVAEVRKDGLFSGTAVDVYVPL